MPLRYPTTSRTLLDKIASGDEITWQEFFLRYNPVVLAVARYKGLTNEEAQDVAQQVMLTFFQQSKTFHFDPDIARFRTYFGRIVYAKIADCYREKYQFKKVDKPVEKQIDANFSDPGLDATFLEEFRKCTLDDAYHLLKQQVSAATWAESPGRKSRGIPRMLRQPGLSGEKTLPRHFARHHRRMESPRPATSTGNAWR